MLSSIVILLPENLYMIKSVTGTDDILNLIFVYPVSYFGISQNKPRDIDVRV